MNNNITEDYVSFEVAKLLKEKGFDCDIENNDVFYAYSDGTQIKEEILERGFKSDPSTWLKYKMPNHALAIKWVRENFGIYIFPDPVYDFSAWTPRIHSNKTKNILFTGLLEFNTPEEATNAALLYTLQNLIP